jgi:hypothetical protein
MSASHRLAGCALLLSALTAAPVAGANATVIDLTYDSVMDMVRPEPHPNIAVHHDLQLVISAAGVVEQRDRNVQQYSDRGAMAQSSLSAGGEDSAYVAWRAPPDGRLVRVQNDPQSTRTMTVTISGNACHLDVVDQLKPGFSEYAFLRVTTHTLGYFSTYRVTRTTCAVR